MRLGGGEIEVGDLDRQPTYLESPHTSSARTSKEPDGRTEDRFAWILLVGVKSGDVYDVGVTLLASSPSVKSCQSVLFDGVLSFWSLQCVVMRL